MPSKTINSVAKSLLIVASLSIYFNKFFPSERNFSVDRNHAGARCEVCHKFQFKKTHNCDDFFVCKKRAYVVKISKCEVKYDLKF